MTETVNDSEVELLSRAAGEKLAEEKRGLPDPFATEVSPSLLSAEHIEKYVMATGLIAPFFTGGGKASRLKKASYEGRIGEKAFIYRESGDRETLDCSDALEVPRNSIVFVESDLDFRLPNYIALRFNLQIRHVHRGLLLGTGPLVDPGYRGKLCIPLHNLTDRDYIIPKGEGLIWIEFTKTTSPRGGRIPLEKDEKEYWKIEDFIDKAARPYLTGGATVPIRSSIPEVTARSIKAAGRALKASQIAENIQRIFRTFAVVGAIATIVAVVGLWIAFWASLSPRIDAVTEGVADVKSFMGAEDARLTNQADAVRALNDELTKTNARIEALEAENRRLRARLDRGR